MLCETLELDLCSNACYLTYISEHQEIIWCFPGHGGTGIQRRSSKASYILSDEALD